MSARPILLCIMDGFGRNDGDYGNAIAAAKTPNLDALFAENPYTYIGASGMDAGLPDGQMGNSEVGHMNIGAGRIVYQELTRITKSIKDGDFFKNEALLGAVENCKKNDSSLHLIGLLSDGGVHSRNDHLYGLLRLAAAGGLKKVFIHCVTDGRDVLPTSGGNFIAELYEKIKEIGTGKIVSVEGRYYAMDRDNRWERVKKAYDAMTGLKGERFADAVEAAEKSYANGVTDEFIVPVVAEDARPVSESDSVVFFNFRPDRARQLTRAFVDPEFKGFERERIKNLYFVCMTRYDATIPNVKIAFEPENLEDVLGEYLSKLGKKQLRIAETEKYAHVTFFFNGGVEKRYEGEDRILVKSPAVATYDLKPEMSAYEITEKLLAAIESDKYDVIVLNYANCDMVGHTGIFSAAVTAVETVDACVGKVCKAVLDKGGIAFVTADHGNAEKMLDGDGSPFTAHTTNPVPFIAAGRPCSLRSGGRLCDVAPTILDVMGIEPPALMTGKSLIVK